ncbi:hypothetical protein [Sphingomonas flavalba]|uniref:hypothetical protein n=1 Tax=Sphingomonas flavalba TaxID=2559804 RepID=UPI00109DE65A|nr:hypothetical protein [Sphingomonas flavalba]
MISKPAGARETAARLSFVKLMRYTVAAAVVMVGMALFYLWLVAPLNSTIVIATTLGVFFSVVLGGGLMAIGFLSSNSGHDERAGARAHGVDEGRDN